ncbi:MAG: YbjN domain-containing protein [Chloroflexi bacterium]|nr:YbjN domain-containing protein [Chloroflexota bacterium]
MNNIEHVSDCLKSLGVEHAVVGPDRIEAGFVGEHTHYEVVIHLNGPVILIVAPKIVRVPENRLTETIKLANWLNANRLMLGAFWVQPEYRFLAFEYGLAAPEAVGPAHLGLALAALSAINAFFPAFARVIWSGAAAHEAVDPAAPAAPQRDEPDDETELDIAV